MLSSRRSRSRRVGMAAARKSGAGASWRSGRRGGTGGRGGGWWAALALIAAVLVGVGYGWGRWSVGRERLGEEVGPPAAVPGAASSGAAASSSDAASSDAVPRGAESSGAGSSDGAPPAAGARFAAVSGAPAPGSDISDAGSRPDGATAPDTALDPLDPPSLPVPRVPGGPPTIAIVIDDLGRSVEVIDRLRGFGVPLTYAVLPFESRTAEVAARLAELGEEYLCHLPMEAQHGVDAGPGALGVGMRPRELRASTRRALDAVPGAAGVNNHMGSALSEDRTAMAAVLEVVQSKGLFFLDSRTSPESVGFASARDLGVPAAQRRVFLDGDRDPIAIRREFSRLLELADGGAAAIAIGHPYPETLAVLAEEIPRAANEGYRFVTVSQVIAGAAP